MLLSHRSNWHIRSAPEARDLDPRTAHGTYVVSEKADRTVTKGCVSHSKRDVAQRRCVPENPGVRPSSLVLVYVA